MTGSTTGSLVNLTNAIFQKDTTDITWIATDGVGNTASCSFKVVVVDNENPNITCNVVDTLTVAVDLGVCSYKNTSSSFDPTITDNCSAWGTYVLSGATSGTGTTLVNVIFNHGLTKVDWTAQDSSGNVVNCSYHVLVVDTQAPTTLAVLAPISFECTVTPPTAVDNCDGLITGTTTTVFTQGVHNVTWTFVDAAGNISTASQQVTVDDITKPVAPVLADLTGECSVTVSVPTAIDNCVGNVIATTTDPLIYNLQGTYFVHWRFDDGNGNILDTVQKVIVKDITFPTITAPADVVNVLPNNFGCTAINVNLSTPVTNDNCAVDTVFNDSPTVFPQGTTIVKWTVRDFAGNESYAYQNVTVIPVVSTITPAPVCDNYTAPDGAIYTTSGVYIAVIPSFYGCDSTITINLTVKHKTFSTITERSCETYTSPSGNYTWTNSGVYMDTIMNKVGCDSIITINLTIDRMPTTNAVTITNNKIFTALADTIAYQWVNCDNGYAWEPSTAQSFTPTQSGNYAVILTNHTCVDSSDCTPITLDLVVPQVISPNGDGVNDVLEINGIYDYPNNVLRIYNRWGNLVYETHAYKNEWDGRNIQTFTVGDNQLPVGTYFYVLDLGKEDNTPEQNTIKGYIYLTK